MELETCRKCYKTYSAGMMHTCKDTEAELREQLAAIEHERWADWQSYLHSRLTKHGEDGMLMSPSDYLHWEEQIAADYAELTEAEKQSDRDQVDRYWSLVTAWRDRCIEMSIDERLQQLTPTEPNHE